MAKPCGPKGKPCDMPKKGGKPPVCKPGGKKPC